MFAAGANLELAAGGITPKNRSRHVTKGLANVVAILKEPFPNFRPMRTDDLETVASIEVSAYAFPWTHGIFSDCLRAGYECWVLARSAEIVGYGVLSAAAREAHILNVCVTPEEQRRGHGRRIVLRLLDLARWHRAERVFLEVGPRIRTRSRCTNRWDSTKSVGGRITTRPSADARTRS